MKKLTHSGTLGRERRARYFELRRKGTDIFSAAAEVGVLDNRSALRYERWFQAEESGQEIIGGKVGRPRIAGREDAILAHVRRYPGLAAYEIGSAALGLPHSQAHHAAAPVLVRLEGAGMVRHEDEPVEGGRWVSVRRWYPGPFPKSGSDEGEAMKLTIRESPNAPRPADPLVLEVADMLYRIEINYEREGSGPGRFEGRLLQDVQAEAVIRFMATGISRW